MEGRFDKGVRAEREQKVELALGEKAITQIELKRMKCEPDVWLSSYKGRNKTGVMCVGVVEGGWVNKKTSQRGGADGVCIVQYAVGKNGEKNGTRKEMDVTKRLRTSGKVFKPSCSQQRMGSHCKL